MLALLLHLACKVGIKWDTYVSMQLTFKRLSMYCPGSETQ